MSKNIMHSRHDEYHKLTRGERIGYGMGDFGNDSNLLIVFYVQIVPDDFVMQLHRF
ncbi:xyloside transporter [Klebsiella pneumoniae]|nr:xyloside transporter [Klebsiella pneumoniae]